MSTRLRTALAIAGVAIATQAAAQVTFYQGQEYAGRSFTTDERVRDFARYGFNDRASSVEVLGGRWEVCEDVRFAGRCVVLRPGRYPSLAAMGLNNRVSSVRTVSRDARIDERRYAPAPPAGDNAVAQVTFYQAQGFAGPSFTTVKQVNNFDRFGFNDRASSVEVLAGRWEVCEDARFAGRCVVLRPGRYPSLAAMGLNDRVSSVRAVSRNTRIDNRRYAPAPVINGDFRRSNNEQLFEADVTSVHAVLGAPEQRCWVEQEQVIQERSNNSIPGTVVGAVLGGILGHQIGGGRGQDIATAGGAVAGAVVGGNIGRNSGGGQQATTQDVKRCSSSPNQGPPEYWDVTYTFRGQEHRMQMSSPPGPSITVNARGEPRV